MLWIFVSRLISSGFPEGESCSERLAEIQNYIYMSFFDFFGGGVDSMIQTDALKIL